MPEEAVKAAALRDALQAAADPAAIERSDACLIANQSYQDSRDDWRRLNNLVYILAVAAVVFLIGGIVLFAVGADTRAAGIVSFVGTVVTGVGARFVLRERNRAAKEKAAAARLVKTYCEDAASRIEAQDLTEVA